MVYYWFIMFTIMVSIMVYYWFITGFKHVLILHVFAYHGYNDWLETNSFKSPATSHNKPRFLQHFEDVGYDWLVFLFKHGLFPSILRMVETAKQFFNHQAVETT